VSVRQGVGQLVPWQAARRAPRQLPTVAIGGGWGPRAYHTGFCLCSTLTAAGARELWQAGAPLVALFPVRLPSRVLYVSEEQPLPAQAQEQEQKQKQKHEPNHKQTGKGRQAGGIAQ
jgi:hypothetical protein